MQNIEHDYINLIAHIMDQGEDKGDRTGTGVRSVFGRQIRHDMRGGFPLLTSKKVNFNAIVHELFWFLNGDTNITYLQDNNVKIWNEWVGKDNTVGAMYGAQWRDFNGTDQIEWLVNELKNNPESRRMVVSAWNPTVLPDTNYTPSENVDMGRAALAACHTMFQLYTSPISTTERCKMLLRHTALLAEEDLTQDHLVANTVASRYLTGTEVNVGVLHSWFNAFGIPKYYLDLQMYQRSADMFLGVPFNIASYALLLEVLAKHCNMVARDYVHTFGDAHVYSNHKEQVNEQLQRANKLFKLPTVEIKKTNEQTLFTPDDIVLHDYQCHPYIKAPIAV